MNLVVKEITNKEIWNDFIKAQVRCSILQSWEWGEFQGEPKRIGLFKDDLLVGTCFYYIERGKLFKYLYSPHGPIIDEEIISFKEAMNEVVPVLANLARDNKCDFVRIDPLIDDNEENGTNLKVLGFKIASKRVQAERFWILDITKNESDLLREMRKSHRYSINRSIKEGVKVSRSIGCKDFEIFWDLFTETFKLQEFFPHPKEYYLNQLEAFRSSKNYFVYKAEYLKEPLAVGLIAFFGKTAYYLHAGSKHNFKIKTIFPAYSLLWQAIIDAKKEGLKEFNFWGVTSLENPDIDEVGFSNFKRGFGGGEKVVIRARDLPISWKYNLFRVYTKLRDMSRKIKTGK